MEGISELTQQWIELLQAKKDRDALDFYCRTIIPYIIPDLQDNFTKTHNIESNYDGIISLLGFTPDTVILTYHFAKPKKLIVLYTKETERFLDDVVKYTSIPIGNFYHEIFQEDPAIDIYRALDASISRFGKDEKFAIELTGGKKTMGGALAVAAGLLDIDQLYIDYKEYMPSYRKPKPESTYIHLVTNPLRLSIDIFGDIDLERASMFFNIGKYDISEELFIHSSKKMNNPRVAEICAKLSKFYYLWNNFDFNQAKSLSKELFDQFLQFYNQFIAKFNINLDILQKQIETINLLDQNNRVKLLWNFFFTAERYEKNN